MSMEGEKIMKKIKKYILSLVLCVSVVLGIVLIKPVANGKELQKVYGEAILREETIESQYNYNAFFTIPDAKISYQGQEYSVSAKDAVVKWPNGNIVSESSFYLNEAGEYTLIYQTVADDKLISAEKEFSVNKGLYSLSNLQSSITYQENLRCNQKKDGVTVKLAKGDTLYFNEAIDLRETDGNFDFIKFYPYSFAKEELDNKKRKPQECSTMTIRLTDCYDSSVYVEYTLAFMGGHSYYRVRSNEQKYSGITKTDKPAYSPRKIIYINDERYVVKYDDDFGTTSNVSTLGSSHVNYNTFDNHGLTFSINPNNYKCYATDISTLCVTDLRSSDIYSKYNLFEGFTTGEVYLSVCADGYVSDYVHFDVERIGKYTGNEIVDRTYSDIVEPDITVLETNGCQEFNIALNEKFKLFDATVTDVNLVGGVNTYVYYKYGTPMQEQVLVVDDEFTPNKLGDYTVVYSAKDSFANVGKKLLTLTCVKTNNDKSINFVVDMPKTVQAGKIVELPTYQAQGINGAVDVSCKAILLTDNTETNIDISTGLFQPLEIGKYKIVYTCTDKLGTKDFSYEVTSVASDCILADKELVLPKYFIKGLSYSVDELKVALYNGTKAEYVDGNFEMSQDGKDFEKIEFNSFKITANEKVCFRFVYNETIILQTGDYKVIDTSYGTKEFSHTKYFYSDVENVGSEDFTVTATSQYVLCTSNKTVGNAKIDYVAPLLIDSFTFDFEPVKDKSNFNLFKLTFTDYYDRNNVHTVTLRNAGDISYVSFDGGQETRIGKLFSSRHSVEFDTKTASLLIDKGIDGGVKYSIEKLFINSKILFSFECVEISGECEVKLYRLFKQTLSNTKVDNSVPQMKTSQIPSNSVKKDSLITLGSAVVADMFSPVLKENITVKVVGPNEQFVTSEEGVVLDGSVNALANQNYTVKCDSYGVYAVTYTAVDQSKAKGVLSVNVRVEDEEAPTIELLDGYQKGCIYTVGKGTTVKVADFEVQDNFGAANVRTHVLVYDCYGAFVNLTEEKTFVANRVGTWQVVYTAYDENGNYASTRYSVVVK